MSEVAVGEVEVTREHRLAVAKCEGYAHLVHPGNEHHWAVVFIESGGPLGHNERWHELAQAIATAEARGRAQSSAEIDTLRGEVARLEACLETMATFQDQRAVSARSLGAFNVANTCAVFADLIRSAMAPNRTHGDGVEQVTLYENESGEGEFIIYGSPEVLQRCAEAEGAPTVASAELEAEMERLKTELANERVQSLEHKTARHLLASELVNLADGQTVTTQLGHAVLVRMTARIAAALGVKL